MRFGRGYLQQNIQPRYPDIQYHPDAVRDTGRHRHFPVNANNSGGNGSASNPPPELPVMILHEFHDWWNAQLLGDAPPLARTDLSSEQP